MNNFIENNSIYSEDIAIHKHFHTHVLAEEQNCRHPHTTTATATLA